MVKGVCLSDKIPEGYEQVVVYVPVWHVFVAISEGAGDLSPEDVEEGLESYAYYDIYDVDDAIVQNDWIIPMDGGTLMLHKPFREQFARTADCIDSILDFMRLQFTRLDGESIEEEVEYVIIDEHHWLYGAFENLE